jgi:hypothetical protein
MINIPGLNPYTLGGDTWNYLPGGVGAING